MFKNNQLQNFTKKGVISFNKMTASPRHHPNSAKIITPSAQYNQSQFNRQLRSILSIELNYQKVMHRHRCVFLYEGDTNIRELINFLRREIGQQFIFFKTNNLDIDYLLTLPNRKVSELKVKRIEITAQRIKIVQERWLFNFQIIKCVGTGGFSRVYLCRGYGKLMAMKAIGKQFILENCKQNIVENQRQILQKCSGHPFITQLHMSFQTNNYLFFCMEYCNGGELFNLLRKVRRMKQADAKFYFLETLAAIQHLHKQKILYRDLKPENIIIDEEGHIRLADYGLSKIMTEDMTHSFCGSAEYMAPEMLMKKGHSFQIDYYCLGALLYQLLFGLPPYYSRNQNELFHNIINKDLQFPPNFQVSKQVKNFLLRMLEKKTDMRFKNVQQIMKHPWLKNVDMGQVLAKKMDPPYKTDMFGSNFDRSDFENDEEKEILKLQKQKDRAKFDQKEVQFQNFFYLSQQLTQIQKQMEKQSQKKISFSKKQPQGPQSAVESTNNDKSLIRSATMKSIDTSQFYRDHRQHDNSPRAPESNFYNSRSGQKLKTFISQAQQSQNSKLSPAHYGHYYAQNSSKNSPGHYGSVLHSQGGHQFSSIRGYPNKTSQIMSASRQSSQLIGGSSKLGSSIGGSNILNSSNSKILNNSNTSKLMNPSSSKITNTSGSKLVEVRSVPFLSRNQPSSTGTPNKDRMGSPININNYINIYTNKSPLKQKVSFTAPAIKGVPQIKKPIINGSYGNYSYNKNYVSSSYKNAHQIYGGNTNGSVQRVKFSSLDKQSTPNNSGGSFLRNAYYQNAAPAGRPYLSNFRQRMNPQKIKKTYKTGERSSFNFFSPLPQVGRY